MRREQHSGRHEGIRLALSIAMDEGAGLSPKLQRHLRDCATCAAFREGVVRVRELVDGAPLSAPDLTPAIMAKVRREVAAEQIVAERLAAAQAQAEQAPPAVRPQPHAPQLPGTPSRFRIRRAARRPKAPTARRPVGTWLWQQRAVAAAVAAGVVIGLVFTTGGVVPLRRDDTAALADEIPLRLLGAATGLESYQARFSILERNWTKDVPERHFEADVAFLAPEAFRVQVRDLTDYPSAQWPRNDLFLVTDGRAWHASGPNPCPAPALPACPQAGDVKRTVVRRPPFHAESAMPTDVIVPMTVLAASDRVQVVGPGEAAGREAVVVQLAFRDAAPLFQYLRFLGSWRPFYPQDPVLVWLDRQTWFPLRYEVFPQPGPARSVWASQMGLPAEPPDEAVFAAVASLSPSPPEPALFRVPAARDPVDLGFRQAPLDQLARAGDAPPVPEDTAGLQPSRWGRFVSETHPRESVAAFTRGLAWLTVARVTGWDQGQPFGVGPLAEAVDLPNGVGYYEPASATAPRRLAVHTGRGELLLSTNLPRADLLRIAGSLPVRGRAFPDSWLVRRWAGGEVRSGLAPQAAIRRAGFEVLMPAPDSLPAGYRASVAELVGGRGTTGVAILFRRSAAELDGDGLRLYQATGQALPPPTEPGAQAVSLRGVTARWSPEAEVLEWVEDGIYRSLSGAGFDLATLVGVAESLRPAQEGSG